MPAFVYVIRDAKGSRSTGQIEGENTTQVVTKLRQSGYTIISIDEKKPGLREQLQSIRFGVSKKDVVLFMRQLSVMLKSGMSLLPSLQSLIKQSSDPYFKKILQETANDIDGGLAFSKAMSKHPRIFPSVYTSMIEAGEEAGILAEVLGRLSSMGTKDLELRARVKSAMLYPVILMSIACIVLTCMLIFIVPKFKDIFQSIAAGQGKEGASLPVPTQILLLFSDLFVRFWWLLPAIIIPLAIFMVRYYRSEKGRLLVDSVALRLPVMGQILLKSAVARFARTLSSLSKSGLPISQGLRIVQNTITNQRLAKNIDVARKAISDGVNISQAFSTSGLFPEMVIQMMAVGEETGSLDEMLDEVADYYDTEVDLIVRNLVTLIEPLILLGMGLTVGFMAFAILYPLFTVVDTFR